MSQQDDHYATLGVAPDAGREEIQAAWRFALAAFHPDRFRDPEQRARAEEISKRANAAWQVLGDERLRQRYDRTRPHPGEARPAGRSARELPCPSCATRFRAPDAGGRTVQLACPACGERFAAMIGARCVGRPRLERGWLGLSYRAVFADDAGTLTTVAFRRLPPELALSEGELFSIVFAPRGSRPRYAIVHGVELDVGWRVR